jgi:hypothetical protein
MVGAHQDEIIISVKVDRLIGYYDTFDQSAAKTISDAMDGSIWRHAKILANKMVCICMIAVCINQINGNRSMYPWRCSLSKGLSALLVP